MALHLRARRGGPLLLAAAAASAAVAACASLLFPSASFVPPGHPPATNLRGGAVGLRAVADLHGEAAAAEPAGADAEEHIPSPGRRAALGLLTVAASLLAVISARAGAARAFELESNRVALYNDKARQLNEAVDWYLYEVRPLIYPAQALMEQSDCEQFGDYCAERSGLQVIYKMYNTQGANRGGGQVVVSKLDRDIFTPMKLLALSNVFDPDMEDELSADVQRMETTQFKLGRAAKLGELDQVKKLYNEGEQIFNSYFKKVNNETGLPEKTLHYLQPIPSPEELETDNYWVRRKQKWLVKKKVDAVSKGNKTARFYAKQMFGDDAVSWDPRGDRADEFYNGK